MIKKNSISAVIVAGGMGKRLGEPIPKAFVPLGGLPLFIHGMKVLDSHPSIDEIIIAVPETAIEETKSIIDENRISTSSKVVSGGKERWNSVENGTKAVSSTAQWILIHDAARPFVTEKVIDSLLEETNNFDALITATPVVDTIRTFKGNKCTGTVDRSTLMRVGTPQMFKRDILTKALKEATQWDTIPTDEAMLMEKCGITVGFSWGDPMNFKVTTPADMEIAHAIIINRTKGLPKNTK